MATAVAGIQVWASSRRRATSHWPVPMTAPATMPPTRAEPASAIRPVHGRCQRAADDEGDEASGPQQLGLDVEAAGVLLRTILPLNDVMNTVRYYEGTSFKSQGDWRAHGRRYHQDTLKGVPLRELIIKEALTLPGQPRPRRPVHAPPRRSPRGLPPIALYTLCLARTTRSTGSSYQVYPAAPTDPTPPATGPSSWPPPAGRPRPPARPPRRRPLCPPAARPRPSACASAKPSTPTAAGRVLRPGRRRHRLRPADLHPGVRRPGGPPGRHRPPDQRRVRPPHVGLLRRPPAPASSPTTSSSPRCWPACPPTTSSSSASAPPAGLNAQQPELQAFGPDTFFGEEQPGTSRWNRIEHRLSSAISMNWRGCRWKATRWSELIGATRTNTGTVRAARPRVPRSGPSASWPLAGLRSGERLSDTSRSINSRSTACPTMTSKSTARQPRTSLRRHHSERTVVVASLLDSRDCSPEGRAIPDGV